MACLGGAMSAHGALVITEILSNSGHGAGSANGDWWELTNTGTSAVSLDGYVWDTDISGASAATFAGGSAISIGSGSSIVITEETDLTGFSSAWALPASQVLTRNTFSGANVAAQFSSLLAAGGTIYLWDGLPSSGGNLVTSATFGAATSGRSFRFDAGASTAVLSSSSDGFSFVATGNGAGGSGTDIGSPGVSSLVPSTAPEPSSVMLVSIALLGVLKRRRS